jgi:peptidoglycan/xylan/chitin deacetylase (PgdA/CDA1 family)
MKAALVTLAVIAIVLYAYFVLPWFIKGLLTRRLGTSIRRAGCVCLTFDDGPDPASTPLILDILAAAGAKATFFILGRNADRHPALVRRIAEAGHEIGEHGHGHRHAWRTGPVAYLQDLLRGRRALAEHLGSSPIRSYRPAFGELNLITLCYLLFGRRRLVMWNVNPRDFDAPSAAEVAKQVVRSLAAGSVVLLHDARADAATDVLVTVEALKLIMRDMQRGGLRLVTITEALTTRST